MRGIRMRVVAIACACAMLGSCAPDSSWRTRDITRLVPDLAFDLTDDRGHAVTAHDYRGKAVLLYFAFTHCPDVCPTTLIQLAQILNSEKRLQDGARVLVVTVDPARDTRAVMHEYVQAFGPQIVGLRGDTRRLDALTRRYRVTYSLGEPDAEGQYEVTHSTAVFVFDRDGHARLVFTGRDTADAIADDLRRLITEAR